MDRTLLKKLVGDESQISQDRTDQVQQIFEQLTKDDNTRLDRPLTRKQLIDITTKLKKQNVSR